MSDPPTVLVDRRGITLDPAITCTLDVFFDGRRVCSVSPARGTRTKDGRQLVRWARALRFHLHGRSDLLIREHISREVVFEGTVTFDDDASRTRIVDEEGHPLTLDKWGKLDRAFEMAPKQDATGLARTVRQLLGDLNEHAGVPAFAAYGTLLGAVRAGRVIGHDFDADVAYFSRYDHPADMARESFSVQRSLHERGWHTTRDRHCMVQAWTTDDEGVVRHIDVFVSYVHRGTFTLDRWVHGPLAIDQLLPLSEVTLEGVSLPAPADPEALLALTYGPTWTVPDPAFQFRSDPVEGRRSSGWMHNHRQGWQKWSRWYRENREQLSDEPSPFASWTSAQLERGTLVLELGCGRGADTLLFATEHARAVGVDLVAQAVEDATTLARERDLPATFYRWYLRDLRRTVGYAALVATEPGAKALYSRQLLDCVDAETRAAVWTMARILLRGGGRAFLEVREQAHSASMEVSGAPLDGFTDLDDLHAEVEARGGVVEHEQSMPAPPGSPRSVPGTRWLVVRW